MAIEFRCVQCGKLLRTGDETAGKQARCPECGSVMAIPQASAAPADAILADSVGVDQPAAGTTPFGPSLSQGPITPSPLDVGDVFGRSWSILKPNFGMCLVVVIVVWLINFGVNMVAGFVPFLGAVIGTLFSWWLAIGMALFFLKTARGQNTEVGDIFTGTPFFVKVVLAQLLLLGIILGIVLVCVLPPVLVGLAMSQEAAVILGIMGGVIATVGIIYVSLVFSQFYYLILDRDVGVVDAFRMSKELMEGNKAMLLLVMFLSFLITVVAMLPCLLGLLVAAPFFALMHAVIYLTITGQAMVEPAASDAS